MTWAFIFLLVPTNAPSEWRCPPDAYADGFSCECGCGIADPDCGETNDRARCNNNFCAAGTVPLAHSAGICAPNTCGDGFVLKGVETCDDGDGLGCDDSCLLVAEGYRCSGLGAGCTVPRCGDGVADPELGERCDDGNEDDGDGCNACQPEAGFVCRLFVGCMPTTCGNFEIEFDWDTQTGETCEDGNATSGDGCSELCQTEPGWACNWEGCRQVICGDGVVSRGDFGGGEQCDDSNTDGGDGCDINCQIEPGWQCEDWSGCQQVVCGDLVIANGEQCDDGNRDDGDGCNGACTSEPGWSCAWTAGPCTQVVCGDGVQMSDDAGTLFEGCDDANERDGDGCDANCQPEQGFVCDLNGCRRIVCGDGVIDVQTGGGGPFPVDAKPGEPVPPPPDGGVILTEETCDDGNDVGGDGCDATCRLEDGWFCEAPAQPCVRPECGDGKVEGFEQCDDGDAVTGDGCSDKCSREAGWVCRTEGEACEPLPSAWVCSVVFYGSGDGCDCGCGSRDPDCADEVVWSCDFNHCLESSPWPTVEDPAVCGMTEPPPQPEPEPGPEVVEEADEVEVGDGDDGAEVVESEPNAPKRDEGCGGGPLGGAGLALGLLVLARRRSSNP